MKIAKNGKIFGKISIVDILVVIVAVVLLKGVYDKYTNVTGTGTSQVQTKFKYTALIKNVSETTVDMIKAGDEIYDKVSNTMIGKVVSINSKTAQVEFEANDGNIYIKDYPGKVDIELEIETEGTIKDGEYLANNLVRVLIGENKNIKSKYINVEANIMSISLED